MECAESVRKTELTEERIQKKNKKLLTVKKACNGYNKHACAPSEKPPSRGVVAPLRCAEQVNEHTLRAPSGNRPLSLQVQLWKL